MYTLFFQCNNNSHTIVSKKSDSFEHFMENESSIVENASMNTIKSYLLDLHVDPLTVKVVER